MASKKEEPKKLYRSSDDYKLLGVCGGISEYFNFDSTIARILCILLTLCWGTGILVYLVCALVMPTKPSTK